MNGFLVFLALAPLFAVGVALIMAGIRNFVMDQPVKEADIVGDWTLIVIESPYAPQTKRMHATNRDYIECNCENSPNDDLFCDKCRSEMKADEELDDNIRYARAAMKDCLNRGEAPYASHLLYTQDGVLDDTVPSERDQGIKAGFAWRHAAKKTVVYLDRGISKGMHYGIDDAEKRGCEIEYRFLGPDWERLLNE